MPPIVLPSLMAQLAELFPLMLASQSEAASARGVVREWLTDAGRARLDEVLAASDLTDLQERLEEFSLDDAMPCVSKAAASSVPRTIKEFETSIRKMKLDIASLESTLGEAGMRRCVEGFEAFRDMLLAAVGVAEVPPPEELSQPATADQEPTPGAEYMSFVDAIYNPTIPIPARRIAAKFLLSVAAMSTIARAEELPKRIDPWIARYLADAFAEGFIAANEGLRKVINLTVRGDAETFGKHFSEAAEYTKLLATLRQRPSHGVHEN